jgi:hypothetical protein
MAELNRQTRTLTQGATYLALALVAACSSDPAAGSDDANLGSDSGAMAPTEGPSPGTTDHCPTASGYPGDDACLPRPSAEDGLQIHVGPRDYDDPDDVDRFVMMPGGESSECWSLHTPNEDVVYFQSSELRGRPGTHHIINTMYTTEHEDGGFTVCRDFGTGTGDDILGPLPSASRAHMPRLAVAPENAGVATRIPARTPMQADMHYFNTSTTPILREFWMNIYTVDEQDVEEEPHQIRGMGGLSWLWNPIPPNSHDVYDYECSITEDGRITQLLGHTHAHGIRETAWIRRASGERLQVFEQYDYTEPQIFQYDSVTQNPPFSANAPGAHTGLLPVFAGDTLEWECEVLNDSDVGLTYTNNVDTGEMCNIWGSSLGPLINCVIP